MFMQYYMFFLLVLLLAAFALFIFFVAKLVVEIRKTEFKLKFCLWKNNDGVYRTKCGEDFFDASESGDIKSWATYCPYCSKKIKVPRGSIE